MTSPALPTLKLAVKEIFFEEIASGAKHEEFRLNKPYWAKRLKGREFSQVVITNGYPATGDDEKRLVREWRGYTIKTITHEHFGPEPVEVFAIDVSQPVAARIRSSVFTCGA